MEKVEYYFREISRIPRGSYNEKAICDYVENFAKERNIKYVRDKMHNIVLFEKKPTEGLWRAWNGHVRRTYGYGLWKEQW